MLNKSMLMAAVLLAASAGAASATTYNIVITGACDTLSLTVTNGQVVGQSNATNCDTSNMIGFQAKLAKNVYPGGKVIIAAGDFGTLNDAWSWAFNLKTLTAELVGTTDGVNIISGPWSFTYTKGAMKTKPVNNGLRSAVAIAKASARH